MAFTLALISDAGLVVQFAVSVYDFRSSSRC